jgi:uncharacterized protein YprB with RNaseH-like and TPR domain
MPCGRETALSLEGKGSQSAPHSLRERLARYRPHLAPAVGAPVTAPIAQPAETQTEAAIAPDQAALSASCGAGKDSGVLIREVRYPVSHVHGHYPFAELYDALDSWEASGIGHPLSSAGMAPRDLLFFDTETTGLQGGTGNTVFLLGYARPETGAVVIRQHILTGPQAETALYASFLRHVDSARLLVTFNGKSFDWPQVKTRHTLLRDTLPALPSFRHMDLLHAARRLWADELATCRLSAIETAKLGVRRTEDIPGHMAPLLYFEFLRRQDIHILTGVLNHNELDVLSLVTLYIHLSAMLLHPTRTDRMSHEERFAVSRWYETLGRPDLAARGYRMIADSRHPLWVKAQIALGTICKREGDWRGALSVWERCAQETGVPAGLWLELAKLCEHEAGDFSRALRYARRAYEAWRKKRLLLHLAPDEEGRAHLRRIERLERKLASAGFVRDL